MVKRAFRFGLIWATVATAILSCELPLPTVFAQESESHTWHDSTGRFSVEAKLIERSATHIKLRTSAGQDISVPIDRLSQSDLVYLKTLASAPGSADPTSDPVEPAVPVTIASPPGPELMALDASAETAPERAALPEEGEVKLPLQNEPARGLATDPAPDDQPVPKGGFTVTATDAYDMIGRPFVLDAEKGIVALSVGRHKINEPDKARGRIFLGQLPQGPLQTVLEIPEGAKLIDFEPSSGRALMVSGFGHSGRGGNLVLLDGLADAEPRQVLRRQLPGIDKPGAKPKVEWARLLSTEHVACMVDSNLFIWNLRTARLLYKVGGFDSLHFPAISPNRRYLAIPLDGAAVIIDVVDGNSRGFVALGENLKPDMLFHPDGRRIALASNNQLLVWDCAQGKPTCEVTLPNHVGKLAGWLAPDELLTGLGRLIRTDLEMTVWGYSLSGGVEVTCSPGGVLVAKKSASSCLLASMPIPHSGAKKAAAQLERGGRNMMLVRPGDKIALDAEVGNGIDRETVISALREAVEKTGWQIVDRADITVVAMIGKGKPTQVSYNMMAPGRSRDSAAAETATITPFTAELQVRRAGKVLWARRSQNMAPPLVILRNGQTLQEAVREYEHPDEAFFARLAIPPRISKPEIAEGLGFSSLKDLNWRDMSAAEMYRIRSRFPQPGI